VSEKDVAFENCIHLARARNVSWKHDDSFKLLTKVRSLRGASRIRLARAEKVIE